MKPIQKEIFSLILLCLFLTSASLRAQDDPPAAPPAPVPTVPAPPAAPDLSGFNLLFSRTPVGFSFRTNGEVEAVESEGWKTSGYTSERKRIYYNGQTPASSRHYAEVTRDTRGNPSRVVTISTRVDDMEFTVTNASGGRINSTTRCMTGLDRARGAPRCWSLNREICNQFIRDAGVTTTDQLFAKVRSCLELNTAVRKLSGPLVEASNRQFTADIQALRDAKELGERLKEARFEFEDPSNVNVSHLMQKFASISAGCMAISGQQANERTLGDVFRSMGYGPEPGGDGRMPRPAVPGQ